MDEPFTGSDFLSLYIAITFTFTFGICFLNSESFLPASGPSLRTVTPMTCNLPSAKSKA